MRTLKTEVGKGSTTTAVGRGSVDPKRWGSSVSTPAITAAPSKGNPVNIPELGYGFCTAT